MIGGEEMALFKQLTTTDLQYKLRRDIGNHCQNIFQIIGRIEIAKRLPLNPTWADFLQAIEEYADIKS